MGAGYQPVLKIHGNHLDTSREGGMFGSKILPKSGLNSHPSKMGEKKKNQLERWVILDSRGHSEGAFSAAIPRTRGVLLLWMEKS